MELDQTTSPNSLDVKMEVEETSDPNSLDVETEVEEDDDITGECTVQTRARG